MNLNKIKFYSPSFSWAFFILFICLLPQNKIPKQHFAHEDLLVHLTLYFILGILVLFAWFKTNTIITIRQLISTWAAISLFGLSIEVLQAILPIHRSFSLEDFSVNSIGVAIIFFKEKVDVWFVNFFPPNNSMHQEG